MWKIDKIVKRALMWKIDKVDKEALMWKMDDCIWRQANQTYRFDNLEWDVIWAQNFLFAM